MVECKGEPHARDAHLNVRARVNRTLRVPQAITRAIKRAAVVVWFASHASAGSDYVKSELLTADHHHKGILPVYLEPFDPTQHEAMAQQPVEGAEPGTVVEVYQQGCRLGDAVIRPARVVVAG